MMGKYKQLYHAYLQSDMWRQKRTSIMRRDHHWCQGCALVDAVHVHHLSYDNIGQEEEDDLISLCKDCHELVHETGPVDWDSWWPKLFHGSNDKKNRYNDRDRTPYHFEDKTFLVMSDGGGSTIDNMEHLADCWGLTSTRAQFLWALLLRTPLSVWEE